MITNVFLPSLDRFTSEYVYSVHPVLARCLLLGGRTETIKARCDPDLVQANLCQIFYELCLRQSAGDSAGPKVNVAAGLFGEFDIERNVSQVEASARPQHTPDFGKPPCLFRHEVEHTVRGYDIDGAIGDGKGCRVPLSDLHLPQTRAGGGLARSFKHGIRHIDANRTSIGSGTLRRQQQIHSGAAADVEDRFPVVNRTDCEWIADSRERCRALRRQGRQFAGIVAEEFRRVICSTMKMEVAARFVSHASIDARNLSSQYRRV